MSRSILLFITITLFISSGICCADSEIKEQTKSITIPVKQDSFPIADTVKTITIMAAGDIMFGSNYPSESYLPPNNGNDLLLSADSLLKMADVTFGNVEGVFMDKGGKPKGSGANVYCFRQPVAYANLYKDYGFDLLSVANNHIYDFGAEGISSTDSKLRKLGIAFAGTEARPTSIIERNGLKIGFTAFAPHAGCLSFYDTSAAAKLVKELKKECAIVIVSFHAGAEGKTAQHVPKQKEIFYSQDRGDVHAFAHKMIDAGADMIIGHGPHVARALELYNSRLIAYSLGNFCTFGQFNLSGVNGYAPLLEVKLDDSGKFIEGKIHSFKQIGEGGPVADPEKNAAKSISELTSIDFPLTDLVISEDGKIEKKQ